MKISALAQFDRSLLITIPLAGLMGVSMVFLVEGLFFVIGYLSGYIRGQKIEFWVLPLIGSLLVAGMLWCFKRPKAQGLIGLQDYTRYHHDSQNFQSLSFTEGLLSLIVHAIAMCFASFSGLLGPLAYWAGWVAKHIYRLVPDAQVRPRSIERHVIGCAVAAALTTALNAPLAAVFFVHEIILRRSRMKRLFPIILAALIASLTERHVFVDEHIFSSIPLEIRFIEDFMAFGLLGLLAGLLSVLFSYSVLGLQSRLASHISLPAVRPLIGGIALAFLLYMEQDILPVALNFEDVMRIFLYPPQGIDAVFILAFMFVAVVFSVGTGYGSGVFAPSLMIGAYLGVCFWIVWQGYVLPLTLEGAGVSDVQVYAIIGMAAFTGAVMGAPFFVVMLAFELSLSYATTSGVIFAGFLAAEVMGIFCAPSLFHLLRGTRS